MSTLSMISACRALRDGRLRSAILCCVTAWGLLSNLAALVADAGLGYVAAPAQGGQRGEMTASEPCSAITLTQNVDPGAVTFGLACIDFVPYTQPLQVCASRAYAMARSFDLCAFP
jgi:hypothetical protein